MADMISPIGGMGGLSGGVTDRQTFGAAVVTQTLNNMNGGGAMGPAPFDRQTFGASVVSNTLNNLNQPMPGQSMTSDMSQTFNASQQVLSAYTGTGGIVSGMV